MPRCPTITVDGSDGLNNKGNPLSLGWQWARHLDNYDLDDDRRLSVRDGYRTVLTGIRDVYAVPDEDLAYAITDSGELAQLVGETLVPLGVDVGDGFALGGRQHHYWWTQAGPAILLMGADEANAIYADRVVSWGMPMPPTPTLTAVPGSLPAGLYSVALTYRRADNFESGAANAMHIVLPAPGAIRVSGLAQRMDSVIGVYVTHTVEVPEGASTLYLAGTTRDIEFVIDGASTDRFSIPLDTQFYSPPPLAGPIAYFAGQVWVAVYDPTNDFTRLFASKPLAYGYFELDNPGDYRDVYGRVVLLTAHDESMLIGTDRAIWQMSRAGALDQMAHYGAVMGSVDWTADGRSVFWSHEGVIRWPPFEPLTADRISVPPGSYAAGLVRADKGFRQFIAAIVPAGEADNRYRSPFTEHII